MNVRPHTLLLALAALCLAASAWAADAPRSAPAPASHAAHVAPAAHGDDTSVTVEVGDADDLDLDALDLEGGQGAGDEGGDRRVIVRRFGRAGMGAGMAGGMRGGMGAGMGRGMGPGRFAHMAQALELTDTQRAKMADIHERQMRRDIQARADIQIARLDLRKAITAERPEAAAINAQIDRVAKLRTDMAKAHVAALLEARSTLTAEQQKKMREMHLRQPGAGMPGMGRGFGMGPGGRGENGVGHGGPPMHVRIERDTLIRR